MPSTIARSPTSPARDSNNSRRSDESYESRSTAPTSVGSIRPPLRYIAKHPQHTPYDADSPPTYARSSRDTYASTNPSIEELFEEPEEYDQANQGRFETTHYQQQYKQDIVPEESRASTPQEFGSFFPSQRRLRIRHDETTEDGNMNLRVDTEVNEKSRKVHLQLFHLRMHDLKKREFSLRRYCRDSGREICHSSRRYTRSAASRPGIQRSLSNAFSGLLSSSKPDIKRSSSSADSPVQRPPTRKDSGYASDSDLDDEEASTTSAHEENSVPTNATKLDFSNYAQLDLTRRGASASKQYTFDYWGSSYAWKRVLGSAGDAPSYHLLRDSGCAPVAHIVPELQSPADRAAEEEAGGWVPPCSLWISDASVLGGLTDVADVIVATGLLTLVDDCIKRHFSPQKKPALKRGISLPLTPLRLDVEFKSLGGVFRRRDVAGGGSPLRYSKPVETM